MTKKAPETIASLSKRLDDFITKQNSFNVLTYAAFVDAYVTLSEVIDDHDPKHKDARARLKELSAQIDEATGVINELIEL